MLPLVPMVPTDVPAVTTLLRECDLTLSGLDEGDVRVWLLRDERGDLIGCTGFELAGEHALIRSVAVAPSHRGEGLGLALAHAALDEAAGAGATTAWLFSRRSGPFWQKLGFAPADRDELARVLSTTHQVRLFERTGQLEREVAWRRSLSQPEAA